MAQPRLSFVPGTRISTCHFFVFAGITHISRVVTTATYMQPDIVCFYFHLFMNAKIFIKLIKEKKIELLVVKMRHISRELQVVIFFYSFYFFYFLENFYMHVKCFVWS